MTARKFGRFLNFDRTTWPDPRDVGEIEHALRYGGELSQPDRLVAASVISAYRHLTTYEPGITCVIAQLRRLWRAIKETES
jgi:cbb3-type cytochrome oxidase cytochrome c subunit